MTDAGRLLAGLLSFSAEEGLRTVLGSGRYVLLNGLQAPSVRFIEAIKGRPITGKNRRDPLRIRAAH